MSVVVKPYVSSWKASVLLLIPNPTQVRLVGYESRRDEVTQNLEYIDKSVDYEIQKFKHATWFANKYGMEAYSEKLAELKAQRKKSLLFEDEHGLWTHSGLAPMLANAFNDQIKCDVKLPDSKIVPWAKTPDRQLRYYQVDGNAKLMEARHGGVEIMTGGGKSAMILQLVKDLGLKTCVMAPSKNIADQLYDEFVAAFGKKLVGKFYGGKKEPQKLFVVGIGASLTRVESGSVDWEWLAKTQVFIVDESHIVAAETQAKVGFGVCAAAPYRFFFSATQMRNDGKDMLLEGITGPIVYRMTVQEGVDQGFLAKPLIRMMHIDSDVVFDHPDANMLTRKHIYHSPKVNAIAANMANKMVSVLGRPTLILVEEMEQFTHLLPHLRYEARFAHGGTTKENRTKIAKEYHESNPKLLVEAFNSGEFPILVGTSCVATGTDFKIPQACIYLRGGKSEVEVRQGVGRTTRLVPGKTDCYFVDFSIDNVKTLKNHAKAREEIYADIYPSLTHAKA